MKKTEVASNPEQCGGGWENIGGNLGSGKT